MEKRFLTTMLAMMAFFALVSYIYPILYPPPPKAPSAKTQAGAPVSGAVAPGSTATYSSLNGEATSNQPAYQGPTGPPTDPWAIASAPDSLNAPIRDIVVETRDIRAIVTENGGRLKSLTLKNYNRDKINPATPDSPLDMVNPLNKDLPLGLWLTQESGDGRVSLANLTFTADRASLTVDPEGVGVLTLTARTNVGLAIVKTLTFKGQGFLLGQSIKLTNEGNFNYQGRLGQTIPVVSYSLRPTRYGAVAGFINQNLFSEAPADAGEELAALARVNADWLGYMDQHFLSAFVFEKGADGQSPEGLKLGAERAGEGVGYRLFQSRPLSLPKGGSVVYTQNLYFGPKEATSLATAGHNLGASLDYGWFSLLAKPLIWLLRLFYDLVGNYGVAIILVTIIIKIALWPLTAKGYQSMKKMQAIQPQIAKLKVKYKDDNKAFQEEMMRVYKVYGVSPLGGCLPMILQIPFFIAFYRVLDYALELRGAPFALWITDLSVPDRLFYFDVKLPLLEAPTGIPVLTLLMGVTMIWQQRMTPSMGDPTQAKIMAFMPLIFIFILINMPSGLVLYWLVNNILSIFQQKLINKSAKSTAPVKAKT
ncbi:MAG: membrane protein insertase YidC [Deltaproteobacteria bacterium]|jgi:YidC/Oxa1 family membrane protein insertase|nr:membrane protein insertase YidC [Deltaproteobacteria bacterium]